MDVKQKIVSEARACLGVPFHHQGRQAKAGLDCIGLVIVALRGAGITVRDRLDYGMKPDGKSLIAAILDHGFRPVDFSAIKAGDLLVFRYDGQPQHVALATSPTTMIHSFAPAGRVVETEIGAYWTRRIVQAFSL